MAHYLILSTGIVSHINAYSALAKWLLGEGHRVTFLCVRDDAVEHLRVRGFDFQLLQAEAAHLETHWQPIRPLASRGWSETLYRLPGIRALLPWLAWPAQWRRARRHGRFILEDHSFETRLDTLKPDVVLSNPEMPHHILRTLARKLPVALLETHVSTRFAPNVPRLDSHLIPLEGHQRQRRSDATWTRSRQKRRVRAALSSLLLPGQSEERALRKLARNLGLNFQALVRVHDGWHPFEFPSLPVLELTARELDFPRPEEPERLLFGPQVDLGRAEPSAAAASDPDKVFPDTQPLILCVMGSFRSSRKPDFLRTLVAAARRRPQWNWVLGLGGLSRETLGSLPPNVLALDHVSQLQWLGRADAMITHGGIATINECVLARVPMVIYSSGFLDRDGNAARVEWHGLGLRGDLLRDNAEHVLAHLERILEEDSFSAALAHMAECFQAYDDPDYRREVWRRLEDRLRDQAEKLQASR